MITVLVNFELPAGLSRADVAARYGQTAPKYRDAKGLIRKYYLHDPETGKGGGCYLFANRADAEAWFSEATIANLKSRYANVTVTYFETPVLVDNMVPEIVGAAA